jgi:asparagine synthase (glutamine-hydrolysing)
MSFKSGGSRYAESMMFLRFPHEMKTELFTSSLQKELDGEFNSTPKILAHFESGNAEELVDRMLYTDMMTRMPEHLLLIVDHMTMAHSLEDRSPLLDRQLVEFAASIPVEIKLKGRQLKYIFKEVARDFLPESLLTRRKQGFAFPLAYWMRGPLGGLMETVFQQSRLAAEGYFQRSYMLNLLNQHRTGKADHNYRLWILLNLELWWRLYVDGLSVEDLNEMMDRWLALSGVARSAN